MGIELSILFNANESVMFKGILLQLAKDCVLCQVVLIKITLCIHVTTVMKRQLFKR